MKIKTAMKITGYFKHVYRAGYCDLQYIMNGYEPTYYNAGVYGWNNDMYIDYPTDTIITTGYRNMRGERIPDYIVKAFESAAKSIYCESYSYDQKRENLEELRRAFFQLLADPDRMNQLEEMWNRYNNIEITATQFYNAIVKGA